MVPSEASVCASSSYLDWCSQGRPSSSAKHATARDSAPYLSRSNRFRCPPVTDGQTDTQTDNYNFSTRDTNTQITPRACVLRAVTHANKVVLYLVWGTRPFTRDNINNKKVDTRRQEYINKSV